MEVEMVDTAVEAAEALGVEPPHRNTELRLLAEVLEAAMEVTVADLQQP